MTERELSIYYDLLIDMGASEEVVRVMTNIDGYNEDTLDNINYYYFGYNSYGQLRE